MNNKLIMNKLNMMNEYTMTAHGIIKAKESENTSSKTNGALGGGSTATVVTRPSSR